MRNGASVTEVDREADADNDILKRLRKLELIGHNHGPAGIGRRNKLDNGDGVVRQGIDSGSYSGSGFSGDDRMYHLLNAAGTWSQGVWTQGVVDLPGDGARFPVKPYVICTVPQPTLAAGAYNLWEQSIEGRHLQDWQWGFANAKPATFQGWMFLPTGVSGTFYLELQHITSGRFATQPVTLIANSWNYVQVTFPPNAVNIIANDNTPQVKMRVWLAAGSSYQGGVWDGQWSTTDSKRCPGQTNLAATANNFIARTGWQLETGPFATPPEWIPFDEQMRRCQRFYWTVDANNGNIFAEGQAIATNDAFLFIQSPVPMRAVPSFSSVGTFALWAANSAGQPVTSLVIASSSTFGERLSIRAGTSTTALAAGNTTLLIATSTPARLAFDARI